MSTPPKERKTEKGSAAPQDNDLTHACLAFIHELAEPLTAIGNFLEAANRLHNADSRSAREKLTEVFEKSQIQAKRANEILRQLRDLLRREPEGG